MTLSKGKWTMIKIKITRTTTIMHREIIFLGFTTGNKMKKQKTYEGMRAVKNIIFIFDI